MTKVNYTFGCFRWGNSGFIVVMRKVRLFRADLLIGNEVADQVRGSFGTDCIRSGIRGNELELLGCGVV